MGLYIKIKKDCDINPALSAYKIIVFCFISSYYRRELYNSGVTVHSIEPGGFRTNVTNMTNLKSSFLQSHKNASPELKKVYGGNIAEEGM